MTSTGSCAQCGRTGVDLEYGADGLTYCSSCAFYGMNRQCNKCKMYLPSLELQQYAGQLLCPFCIQDVRKEVAEGGAPHARQEEKHAELETTHPDHCERCGKEAEKLYLWNHLRLCKKCLEEGKKTWQVTGNDAAAPVELTRQAKERHVEEEKRERERFEEDWKRREQEDRAKEGHEKQPIFTTLLRTIGVDKKGKEDEAKRRGEIVPAPRASGAQQPASRPQNTKPGTNEKILRSRIPNLDLARPMSEGKTEQKETIELERKPVPKREDVGSVPQTEGLMAVGGTSRAAAKSDAPKKDAKATQASVPKKSGKGKR